MSSRTAATQPAATQQAAHAEHHPRTSSDQCGFQSRAAGAPACTRGGGDETEECIKQATAVAPSVQCSTTSDVTKHELRSTKESGGAPTAAPVDYRLLNRLYQQRHRERVKVRVCCLSVHRNCVFTLAAGAAARSGEPGVD